MRHVCDLGTGLVGSGRSDIYVKSQPLPQETLSPPPRPPKRARDWDAAQVESLCSIV